ncbi:MAG: sigma-54 dependent transcriptional regulator [Planctomycetota bacterium]
MKALRVLFADDDDTLRRVLGREMEAFGFEVRPFPDAAGVVECVRSSPFDVALLDLRLPSMDGVELMEQIHAAVPDLPVVMLTGHGAVPDAVAAMRSGAYDFLTKPVPLDLLRATIERAHRFRETVRENQNLRRLVQQDSVGTEILGENPAMRELRALTERVGRSDANVLVLGESGTGKELVARSVHARSERAERPFVVVNCGAIPETLIASELFGHEKGAFTGAAARRTGLLEAAHGGTVFLDEIGELPVAVQPTLLRALQFGEVQPVGSERVRAVDIRVIAATHRDLLAGLEAGWFREDLYYRLSTLVLEIPPLRERRSDVPLLAAAFLACATGGREPAWRFAGEALDALQRHDWPGNVRELENAVVRLVTLAAGPEITPADVDRFVISRRRPSRGELPTLDLQELERQALIEAMRLHGGDKRAVAAELGVALKTVYNKLSRYGVSAP